jgi:hypothetical protein
MGRLWSLSTSSTENNVTLRTDEVRSKNGEGEHLTLRHVACL